MNNFDFKILYTVASMFKKGDVINDFGDREFIEVGYIAMPCYLIEERKKYTSRLNYDKNFIVVYVIDNFNTQKMQVPEINLYGECSNSCKVNKLFTSLPEAVDAAKKLNKEFIEKNVLDQYLNNDSLKNISFNDIFDSELEKFENKYIGLNEKILEFVNIHHEVIYELDQLDEFQNKNSDKIIKCSVCNKLNFNKNIKIYDDEPICSSCFIRIRTKKKSIFH